jgi:uncharacterized protein YjbI with pentapeptide repeats
MVHRFIPGLKDELPEDPPPKPIIVRAASLANSSEKFELNFDEILAELDTPSPKDLAPEDLASVPLSQATATEEGLTTPANGSLSTPEADSQALDDLSAAVERWAETFTPTLPTNGKMHGMDVSSYDVEKGDTISCENGTLAVPVEVHLSELSPPNPSPLDTLPVDEPTETANTSIAEETNAELTLALQGDTEALKSWLNQALADCGMEVVEVYPRGDRLQITVESPTGPSQDLVDARLRSCLIKLKTPALKIVELFGQKAEEDLPLWRIEHNLSDLETAMEGDELALPSIDEIRSASSAKRDEVEAFLAQYEAGERMFQKINLSEANLGGVSLTLADLQEAVLTWADLSEASLYHVNLNYAKLRFANLKDAKLRSASLQGTDFTNANLTGADLSWSNLQGANLTGADLTDANLQNAILERVVMPDGTLLD